MTKSGFTSEQETLLSMKHSLMDELSDYQGKLHNRTNRHRVYLAWKRLEAIKITDEGVGNE